MNNYKRLVLLLVAFLAAGFLSAQKRAVTDEGDVVILNSDGTWEFLDEGLRQELIIPVNDETFEKDSSANFLVKSSLSGIGVWINPKIWRFEKIEAGEDAEYSFDHRQNSVLTGRLITEKTKIPIENLKIIALTNFQNAAPNAKIIGQEYRMVNGLKVLALLMEGTSQGIKLLVYGYYYTYEEGTIQLVTLTSEELFEEDKGEMESLLNSLVVLENGK